MKPQNAAWEFFKSSLVILMFVLFLLFIGARWSYGQTALPASQVQVPTLNLSSTIAGTGTFQVIQAANLGRRGCLIQNTSSNNQYLFFGPLASATQAKSILLAPGAGMPCNTAGVITTDEIAITGTATDTFYAGIQ